MRRRKNYQTLAIILIGITLLVTTSGWAQSFRGSIRGTVTDPSGSVIAGAKLTAKNISTGLQRQIAEVKNFGWKFYFCNLTSYLCNSEPGV